MWFCKNPTIVPEVGGCFRTEASLGDWRKVGASPVLLLETRSSHSRPFVTLSVSAVSKEFIVILFL